MSVPVWAWVATLAAIMAVLAVDLLAHRRAHRVTAGEALAWSAVWLVLGSGFGVVVWAVWGAQRAGEYFGGYLIEKSLSVDNIFVFALIFASFAVPQAYQHRVLFYGVLGALVMRAGFIVGGVALLGRFHWILYTFGAFLLVTAGRMVRARGGEPDLRSSRLMRLVYRALPAVGDYQGQRFWIRQAGRLAATPLLVVLVLIEVSDLIFAADSIPAILAITREPFLVFTSNAFAILGLRSLYFLLADLIHRFAYLKLGLAAVLGFVGLKMLLADVITIPIAASLAVIAVCLAVAIIASLHDVSAPGLVRRRRGSGPGRPVGSPAESAGRFQRSSTAATSRLHGGGLSVGHGLAHRPSRTTKG
jgi:TerC family integral membrane protein